MTTSPFRIGLIGFGNIGSGMVRHLLEHGELLAERLGRPLELAAIADREFEKPRGVTPPASTRLTTNWRDLIADPSIELIVELVGVGGDGKPTLAREIAVATLGAGKDFVTANKALIALHGGELHDLAARHGGRVLYEAAVGAGIPLIGSFQTGLAPDRIDAVHGIVNGTTNHILTRIEDDKALTLQAAIKEAQDLGYAEPDPKFDVEGDDAAYKIVVLASLAFGQQYPLAEVRTEGITRLGEPEFAYARANGLCLKLIASARRHADGRVEASVSPTFLPARHVMANVRGVFNAALMEGTPIGQTMYYGRGAGQGSTGSGLLADVLVAGRARAQGGRAVQPHALRIPNAPARVVPVAERRATTYVRVMVGGDGARTAAVAQVLGGPNVAATGDAYAVLRPDFGAAEADNLLENLRRLGIDRRDVCLVRSADF